MHGQIGDMGLLVELFITGLCVAGEPVMGLLVSASMAGLPIGLPVIGLHVGE